MTAKWPTSVATDADLSVAVNFLQTTLDGAIDDSTTTVVLADASSFPTAGYITIDTEVISYTGKSGNTLTGVARHADGTAATSHANAAPVFHTVVAAHHNALKDEVKAIETSLDLTASRAVVTDASGRLAAASVTSAELGHLNGLTASKAVVTDGDGHIGTSAVSSTTLGYLDATSSVQTQLNAKAPTASPTFTGNVGVQGAGATFLDAVNGTAISLAANATTNLFGGGAVFSGLLLLGDQTDGSTHLVLVTNSATYSVAGPVGWSVTKDTGSKSNIYVDGSNLVLQNKNAVTHTYYVTGLRVRAAF